MKITISGSQCVGKTTLIKDLFELDEIKNRFQLFNETTRNVLRDHFGIGSLQINENGGDDTQKLICAQHLLNHTFGLKDSIYDRCALDGLVYTTYLYNNKKVSKETLRIAETIFKNLKYDIMFYIPPEVSLEEDGERSISTVFRDDICEIFDDYIQIYNIPIGTLSGTREKRVQRILETINSYDSYYESQNKLIQQFNSKLNKLKESVR